jgi:hypothetical protein
LQNPFDVHKLHEPIARVEDERVAGLVAGHVAVGVVGGRGLARDRGDFVLLIGRAGLLK